MKYRIQISGIFEIEADNFTKEQIVKELNNIQLNEFLTIEKVELEDVEEVE